MHFKVQLFYPFPLPLHCIAFLLTLFNHEYLQAIFRVPAELSSLFKRNTFIWRKQYLILRMSAPTSRELSGSLSLRNVSINSSNLEITFFKRRKKIHKEADNPAKWHVKYSIKCAKLCDINRLFFFKIHAFELYFVLIN